ncbi:MULTISPECIES: YSIRK-type signal peptide-containing protein [Streptococcus]|uniref:YSIRK-type signal peptide-containing protein n=1 Tax=Streptococcus TaxID=1301 RepID=UPI001562E130|nr:MULTISPECIES: YSIRK-type signal peptide-containing protein [Streptococcus]MBF9646325.1 YSIRK-type signal peptide-containing protein [Streptococcus pseudopneumoniae]MBF9656981.1 YSIRK-type signal peptide-containing protein [Streptococcus pseudopneumoniae]MBF9677384.1 YSIRK-type signal peptide-containing protein [Streptococcus pseudopneumoniae]MCE2618762.1 YSIRK-type signal peptide-containing protein [Streptococcus pseudopneumoniae]
MFKKKNDGNGEKIFRYSIRKYHFGAASVAVAALMFFANGVQAQAPAVSSATASDVVAESAGTPDKDKQESDGEEPEKVSQTEPSAELQSTGESNSPETKIEDASKGQETADLAPTKPEAKPAAQETSQSEREKEQDQPTSVTKTTEAKSLQGNLQALLEKLTLSSMKALHDEVESRLAAAKAVLDDPKATQAQVDEQVRAMEELTSRVNQALEPSLPKLTDLGEASSTNNKLSAPDGAVTEQASSGKRRKRGGPIDLEPAANQVSPTDAGKEAAPEANSQSTPRELPTYTNTTEGENGAYGLKKELEDITKELRRYGASEDKIQAAKAAADKFNEAFSKGDTISQEDFAAALVDLKKSRDLIEGVLEEKYGEETTGGGVTPQPRDGGYSDFRNANYSGRSARAARAGENYSEEFKNAKESYFEKSGNKGNSPYGRYTYVYYSDRTPRNNATRPVSEAENYIKYTVTSTSDGFRWQLELNNGYRTLPGHSQVWFTVPSGQEFKHGTDGISISNQGGGTTAYSPNTSDILSLLKVSQAQFGRQKEGTPQHVGATNRFGIRPLPADNLTQLATQGPRGTNPYRRDYQSQEERSSADEKFRIINSSTGRLFYFELPNSNRKYKITFETRGNNDIKKLVYAAGMRFLDGNELLLANQWHARTRTEAEEDAKELNDAKTNAISAINAEADRKNREIDSANLLPADVTKLKQQVEAAKTNGITEVNRATSPQDVTTKKDTAVGAITGISLDEAKRNKAAKELNDAKTNAISAINDDGSQGGSNNQGQPATPSTPANSGDSTGQATAPSAQDRETGNATAPESPQGLSGSSVTAPARSRRSVSFAGGAQSSQEKQVDKSVLRDLIQDLETRLKDLDGIDQSVIDAAKIILGEGQAALRNTDLTEAGLREITAKVKEALESLKGKQATKDEETKETSKEQDHLPYGTMIASLLALLGLLLFLIARRKKESELKKLTKELTKVLQENDLTSVDAKILDQAREALAQAVAFLANEKESDHTEDELIEKLKAILAQLR